ncbi:POZ domain-containing protein [Obba rivulosa]|uniref:Elongin-C n=1 Tax=Obba rivulosa TaxID=1052685 RepID=A0A8E2AGJ8_9APHY|nr:POZ domain-containing protein [Obba rivulosa]
MSTDKDNDWVRLISADGYSFLVRRHVACRSGTLKNMLSMESSFSEAVSNTCTMKDERGAVVERLCEYLQFKAIYDNGSLKKEELPDFTERLAPEVALELLMAADYYEC